jgi:hypothetical protein
MRANEMLYLLTLNLDLTILRQIHGRDPGEFRTRHGGLDIKSLSSYPCAQL